MKFARVAMLVAALAVKAQQPFTLQQALSAPVASELTAAPGLSGAKSGLFAWVENAEGRRNLWVGGADTPARMLTHNAEDDGQAIRELAWSPDAQAIAYTYGAESGADGKPANPAHLQRATPLVVMVQPVDGTAAMVLDEGHAPLFSKSGREIFYVRAGQIWAAAMPFAAAAPSCLPTATICALPVQDRHLLPAQLIFDRGSARELRLSPNGKTLAFISRRTEINEPSHSFLALFDLRTKTLSFPAPSTGSDLSPVWSPDGKEIAWLRAPFTDTPEFALDRVSANPWSIEVLEVATGKVRQVFAPEANKPGSVLPKMASGEPPLFFGEGGRMVFASEADGWVHLYSVDAGRPGVAVLLTPGAGEVDEPVMDSMSGEVYYASNAPLNDPLNTDRRHIWRVGVPATTPEPIGVTRIDIENHPQPSASGLGVLMSDTTYPMRPAVWVDGYWFFLNPFYPIPSGFPAGLVAQPQRVMFESADGIHLDGQVFVAQREKTAAGLSAASAKSADSGRDDNAVGGGEADSGRENNTVGGGEADSGRDDNAVGGGRADSGRDDNAVGGGEADSGREVKAVAGGRADSGRGDNAVGRQEREDFGREDNVVGGGGKAGLHELRALSKDSLEQRRPQPQIDGGQRALSKDRVGQVRKRLKPAVIFLHGGPRRQMLLGYPPGEYYSNAYAMNQYLASRGFVVLSVNYRCGTGYGLAFRQCASAGPTGAKEYQDVLAAVAYLRSRGDVDMKRVGLWGGSYGGYLTALGLARNSDLFAAGVDFHGVHDWNWEDNAGDWLRGSFAERDAIAVKARANSPIGDVAKWRSPVLLIHGDDDPDVAYAQTPRLAEALRARGVHVEELIFPDEVHGFLLHKDWLKAYEATADFLERELQPGR